MGQSGQYLLAVGLDCYKWYQSQIPGNVPARTLGPHGGWIVRSHIGLRGEEAFLVRVWKLLPKHTCFKTVRLMAIRNVPRWTISVSNGLGLLQIVSEPDTGRCASEYASSPRRVDCEIPHRLERGTKHFL